jgi:hypothetical protein
VLPADRDPRARRRRRQAWTFVTLVSLVLLTGLVAFGQVMRWWTIGGGAEAATARPTCPEQTTLTADEVTVGVYNATSHFGLARSVARELQARGFTVTAIGDDISGRPIKGTAVVRYGPLGRKAAKSISLQVIGPVMMEPDTRPTRTVDLVLGPGYKTMIPRPRASAAIAPRPTPEGCVFRTASPTPTARTTSPPPPLLLQPSASRPAPSRSVLTAAPTTPPASP